jgi:hypothetical protein
MVKIIIEKGDRKATMKNIRISDIYSRVNETEIKLQLLKHMCEMIEDRDWTEYKKKTTVNNLRACKILLSFRKLEYLLYRTVIDGVADGNDLSKILPLIKIKFQECYNDGLEFYQELLDKDYFDEGQYLQNVNTVKEKYEETMSEFSFFERINNGWKCRLEADE